MLFISVLNFVNILLISGASGTGGVKGVRRWVDSRSFSRGGERFFREVGWWHIPFRGGGGGNS